MAESNDNWFSSWLTVAKTKGSELLEFVKNDLEEFGFAVKTEASNVASSTSNAIEKTLKLDEPESTASNMKRSISSFLGQMNEVLNPSPDDSDTEAILIVEGQEAVTLTKLQQAVYNLQKEEKTFTEDPDESLRKQYECWLEIIEDQLSDERLSKHLMSSNTLKNQYTGLVPLKVDHGLFWKRYLFKKALLEDEIAKQEAMEKREAKDKQVSEDAVQWDEEDFAKDIELTEEEQIRLLEQYENETKQKTEEQRKITPPKSPNGLISENTVFQQEPKKSKTPRKKGAKKAPSKEAIPETTEEPKLDIEIIQKEPAVQVANSSSSSSTDGDWEKITEADK